MRYARYDDILQPTWTTSVGTERTGYEASHLGNLDPSDIFWSSDTAVRLVTDLGSAKSIAAVALINHTFQQGLTVLVQANSSNSWTSPALSQAIPIPAPYLNGFACHAFLDLTALAASYRYVSISNVGHANDKTVAIGEIVIATSWRTLDPSLAHDYKRPLEQLVSRQSSKRGVATVYDLGTRTRSLVGRVRVTSATELDTLLDIFDEQHGSARPQLIQLDENGDSRRDQEPHLARYAGASVTPTSIAHQIAYDVDLQFEELGCGEVVGA